MQGERGVVEDTCVCVCERVSEEISAARRGGVGGGEEGDVNEERKKWWGEKRVS